MVRMTALGTLIILFALLGVALSPPAQASTAWGSINNFDAVNDTGVPCHGFEIEIDGAHSTDVTYTYDWNHYGVPKITEDITDPLNPKVYVRYESAKNPDGTWVAFTAVPSGPISPTDGHQFTDPSVNFGGEHFGAGYYGTPSAVQYHWLKDDGAGNLVFAGAVSIATPTFTYAPPAGAVPAQVQAAIVPPPPPAPPVLEFGDASWVKETRTSSHNSNPVEIRDLVSPDPNDANARDWTNGEPDEVEVEWQLFQTDFNAGNGGPNGELVGAPEDLPGGDEVITRRYDFFKYVGPVDPDTGEALADVVGPDGIHGVGVIAIGGVDTDLSTIVVVGDYVGAQMAGFDAAARIGLIDHLQDGELNAAYVDRTVVIGGTAPIATTSTGALPDGMSFDLVTGVLSGTPTVSGTFTFTVHSTDAGGGDVTHTYNLTIVDPGVGPPPPHITVTTLVSPAGGGSTSGDGEYLNGTNVTVVAIADPGFAFTKWTDGGTSVSTSPSYEFTAEVNRELVANFRSILVFPDVGLGDWAVQEVAACYYAGIVKGYADGTYRPKGTVTRGQMAIYIARALAGGDELVPSGPATPTFADVSVADGVYRYVEYAAAQKVVTGYKDGTYQPSWTLNRGQMAAFLARSMCGGEASVPTGPATASFADVPEDFPFYDHVEYIFAAGVTTGYKDGLYHPEYACLRDQMAVFVARAFSLPM